MQFFPAADIFNPQIATPLKGFDKGTPYSYAPMQNGENSFKDIFARLKGFNEGNNPGVPVTMRSTRDDNSYLKSDDLKFLKEELSGLGVSSAAIDEFFVWLSGQAQNPTLGGLKATVDKMKNSGRQTQELSDQELVAFRTLTEKLGFTDEERVELEDMAAQGKGLELLQAFKKKMDGKEIPLDKDEVVLLSRAADLFESQLEPIMAYWNEFAVDDKLLFTKDSFDKIFGTTMASLDLHAQQIETLSEKMGTAILAMLENKQLKMEAPLADNRGSALSARSETMARILATLINEEESKDDENGTSHLIDDKQAGKVTSKQSVASAVLDKSSQEQAKAQDEDVLPGVKQALDEKDKSKEFGAAANTSKNSGAENLASAITARNSQAAPQDTSLREAAAASLAGQNNSEGKEASSGEKQPDEKSGKSGQDLFGTSGHKDQNLSADKAAFAAKVQEAPGMVLGMFGNAENSSSPARTLQSVKAGDYSERIFDQIERGIIKNATDGSKQITLRLDPPELGKLTLSLTVAQGEVKAVIRTESSATTQVVGEQLAQLKQSLEEQGFKVSSLEVETRPQSHAGTDQWSGADQHNQEREMLEQQRFLRLSRNRSKEPDTLAQSMQHTEHPASISASGIHIVA